MIFFLSSLILASSALEYPAWGDWQYGPEMTKYDGIIPQPGCVTTSECASLIDSSFNGAELEVCLKSAKKGCTFIAQPRTYEVENVRLTYQSWEHTFNDLVPPSWATGCNATITDGTVNATSIQMFQDFFARIPTDDLEMNNGHFELRLLDPDYNTEVNYDNFKLYLANDWDLSSCENFKFDGMTEFDLKDKWNIDSWGSRAIDIPLNEIIGKGSVLVSYDKTATSYTKQRIYVVSMSFRSEPFLAYFKGSGSANSDSAQSIISLSLLSLALVTLIM